MSALSHIPYLDPNRSLIKTALALIVLLGTIKLIAQENLVPNPDFEEYHCIPNYTNNIECLKEWRKPEYNFRTPDYLHRLNDIPFNDDAGLPDAHWGYQDARSGDAMVALHMFTDQDAEDEYITVNLKDSLEVAREYEVSAWVSLADKSYLACNGHGFLFSLVDIKRISLYPANDYIFYYNPEIITEMEEWVQIKGHIVADRPYDRLTLGNFIVETDKFESIIFDPPDDYRATYYFEDISVRATERKIDMACEILDDCLPVRAKFTAINVLTGTSWKWRIHNLDLGNEKEIVHTFTQRGNFNIELKTEENGKTYTISKTITIDAPDPPIADFEMKQGRASINQDLNFENSSALATSYLWDFGDGDFSEEENPEHRYEENGEYTVQLIASNFIGCADTLALPYYIACANKILANTFTPNGDGQNDVFPFDKVAVCGLPLTIRHVLPLKLGFVA